MNFLTLLTALSSIGTLAMAVIYFTSISLQIYQMKQAYLPALNFDQIFLIQQNHSKFRISNNSDFSSLTDLSDDNSIKFFNLGGGAATNITVRVFKKDRELIREKNISILPSKASYLIPINDDIYIEFEKTLASKDPQTNLKIIVDYNRPLSNKVQRIYFTPEVLIFNESEHRKTYELQFLQTKIEEIKPEKNKK